MSQALVVTKFGGTSVTDFDSMSRSVDIVLSDVNTRLVVLSASAGVTNILVSLAEGQEKSQRNYLLNEIRCIQYRIIDELSSSKIIRDKIDSMLEDIAMLSEAAELASSHALTDELVSYGELMSTLLFVEILHKHQVNAKWFDVRYVMKTNDHFGNAKPDIEKLKQQVIKFLQPYIYEVLVVTQGFIGRESGGRTTTLGRGGSDYTAALLGEALSATRIDIWTDVAGIYTTDPRIVPSAKRIEEITFDEAAEMATFGAKVLHPATLLPAVRSNIPVFVGSSKDPTAGGTRVCNYTNNPPLFRALALRRKQILVTLHSLNMLHTCGFLAKVFNILLNHNISVDLITTSEVSISLTIDNTVSTCSNNFLLTQDLFLELSSLCKVEIEENLSLITIIGNDLIKACGIGKVFGFLELFNLRMICYGSSRYNLCFLVPTEDSEEVIRVLHDNLFGS